MAIVADHTVMRRFMAKVSVSGGCWEWTGARDPSGYGAFRLGKKMGAHRVAYEMFTGQIPAGLDLDHLCRNRVCVNPDHLEPVSRSENMRRGLGPVISALRNMAKTHCPQGHELSEGNLVRSLSYRKCRTCERDRKREYMRRVRAAA